MLNLAVFISGGGSNLQAVIDACAGDNFPARIQIVISNTADAYGLERAKAEGIPAVVIDHKDYKGRAEFENALQVALSKHEIDLICLAGFMRILTPNFIEKWPNKIINTHPSLLPKYGGKGMFGTHPHEAVLEAGDDVSGCTIHYVTAGVDEGEIIIQKSVDVLPDDSVESLAARVLAQEHIAYVEAVRKIAETR